MINYLNKHDLLDVVKTLNNKRGKRDVYFNTESPKDNLSESEKEIIQEIADQMGEKIYAGNHWDFLYIMTFKDIFEDFCAYIEMCMDNEDFYANISLSDYVCNYFTVFEPKVELI